MDDTNVKTEETIVIATVKEAQPKERRLAVDIDAELFDAIDSAVEQTGWKKKDIVQEALLNHFFPEDTEPPYKLPDDLPLEIINKIGEEAERTGYGIDGVVHDALVKHFTSKQSNSPAPQRSGNLEPIRKPQ